MKEIHLRMEEQGDTLPGNATKVPLGASQTMATEKKFP
jgi:hypothetical protein